MNQHHLDVICEKFNLGSYDEKIEQVYAGRGGSIVRHLKTKGGNYAIKQLASDIDLANEKIISKYELSEQIACLFSQAGIRAVFAMGVFGNRLTMIENTGYLLYPWMEGHTLQRNEFSESHALKVAEVAASLHSINLIVPNVKEIYFDIHSNDDIISAIEKLISCKHPANHILRDNLDYILNLNKTFVESISVLRGSSVLTHGDIDQLNIIWDKVAAPILVDWEGARKMNPTHEMVRTAVRFSTNSPEGFSFSTYANMLRTYESRGGLLNREHIEAAVHAMSGGMINYLLYNINLACSSESLKDRDRAFNELDSTLNSIQHSQVLISQLLKIK